jgi:hypothetical protein
LLNSTCLPQCPDGYRENFLRTRCDPATDVPVIYFPFLILTALVYLIAWMGKKSSKNISGQHRVLLSFYALAGFIDVLAMWALLILTLAQALELWQVAIPAVALLANYYLNWRYIQLWNEIDPPKPKDDDELTLKEVILINKSDQYFDRWNEKYFGVAKVVRRLVMFASHKIFQLPYTHFYGFLHLTVRIQNNCMSWEWNTEKVLRFQQQVQGAVKVRENALIEVEGEHFQYFGKLVEKLVGDEKQKHDDLEEEDDGAIDLDRDKLYEGGVYEGGALLASERRAFDPFLYVQHPEKRVNRIGEPVPDLRIRDMFKRQMVIDFLFIRFPLIAGSLACLALAVPGAKLDQLEIQRWELMLSSLLMMGLQCYVWKTWEAQKLPFKMRDTKANYLFKPLRYPDELAEYQLLKQDKGFMPDWDRYLPHYLLPEIFLDNKLEELLNIFGRRQCKSCIEFATGTELEADPRRHRSFPLSPRGEALYRGMEHEFNLVDF